MKEVFVDELRRVLTYELKGDLIGELKIVL